VPNGARGSASGQICVDGVFKACGAVGQPCCELDTCAGTACCVNATCVAAGSTCTGPLTGKCSDNEYGGCGDCGGAGQPCCGSSSTVQFCTGSSLTCASGECQSCGTPGHPCCDGRICLGLGCCVAGKCVAPGGSCGTFNGSCVAGYCAGGSSSHDPCGGIDMDDCFIGDCTAPYTIDYASDCDLCGIETQKCCSYKWCSPGLACSGSSSSATCTPCGLSGQPCCDGMFCISGVCASGTCP
jgi:hypothetical protein